jgi:hypothetical protein
MAEALRPLTTLTPHELRLAYEDAETLARHVLANALALTSPDIRIQERIAMADSMRAAPTAVLRPRRLVQLAGDTRNPYDRKGPL